MAPEHIGIILDGNRRWAKREGLTSFEGHQKGIDNMKNIAEACLEHGIKVMTCYCFSTENWKRSPAEVNYLMRLFESYINKHLEEFHKKNVRLRHIGRHDRLPKTLLSSLQKAAETTKNNTDLTINLAINYGGRDEIVRAAKKAIEEGIELTEESISTHLDTGEYPAPALIIRTSGEERLSNFLIWQAAYSEFFFIQKHFPELSKEDFAQIIKDFNQRNRRFGGN